ncbi:hypothetical protein QQG55_50985 [Brugia pahangi]
MKGNIRQNIYGLHSHIATSNLLIFLFLQALTSRRQFRTNLVKRIFSLFLIHLSSIFAQESFFVQTQIHVTQSIFRIALNNLYQKIVEGTSPDYVFHKM